MSGGWRRWKRRRRRSRRGRRGYRRWRGDWRWGWRLGRDCCRDGRVDGGARACFRRSGGRKGSGHPVHCRLLCGRRRLHGCADRSLDIRRGRSLLRTCREGQCGKQQGERRYMRRTAGARSVERGARGHDSLLLPTFPRGQRLGLVPPLCGDKAFQIPPLTTGQPRGGRVGMQCGGCARNALLRRL